MSLVPDIDVIVNGFTVATTAKNLLFCFAGVFLGTLIGVLPGIGPFATIALLLPVTFYLSDISAIIMLAGIYYGSQYGGSTTSILLNLPGEAAAVVTCLDGNMMAKNGRAGPALTIAALASLLAGLLSTGMIALFAPAIAKFAESFTSTDFCALMIFGLIGSVVLASGPVFKAILMVLFGALLGTMGTDLDTGATRYTFGSLRLADGLEFVAVVMGLFGVAEILTNMAGTKSATRIAKIGSLFPSREEFRRATPAAVRGTFVGAFFGIVPGGGALLSSYAAYALEKKMSKSPERFGRGAVEGVAGPEAANNAGAQTGLIPLLSLGVPPNAIMALLLGALMIHGVNPGPLLITQRPDLYWGLLASMLIGNVMLVILNLPLIGLWVQLLRVPTHVLYPGIVTMCAVGAYSINLYDTDVLLMGLFGVVGFVLRYYDYEAAPFTLAFLLSRLFEENFKRSMIVSGGQLDAFLHRPISLVFLGLSVLLLVLMIVPALRARRRTAFQS